MALDSAPLKDKMAFVSSPFDTMYNIISNNKALEKLMYTAQVEEGVKQREHQRKLKEITSQGDQNVRVHEASMKTPYVMAMAEAVKSFNKVPLPEGADYNTELINRFRNALSLITGGEGLAGSAPPVDQGSELLGEASGNGWWEGLKKGAGFIGGMMKEGIEGMGAAQSFTSYLPPGKEAGKPVNGLEWQANRQTSSASTMKVAMIAPDGRKLSVPRSDVKKLVAAGAKIAR